MNKKGQAALEFLMTYGWTILAAIVSIAAFAQFGLVSTGTLRSITGATVCALPPGLACDYKIGSNGIQLVLTNGFHARIVDVSVRVISTELGGICVFPYPESNPKAIINVGESKQIFVHCPDIGNAKNFKGDIEVSYRFEDQSISHTDTGTIRGSVEEGTICVDADEDGYQASSCGGNDCNDSNPNAHPNNPPENTSELCTDGIDNDCFGNADEADPNCQGIIPEGQSPCPINEDNDGHISLLCVNGDDCNDSNNQINPSMNTQKQNNVLLCTDEIDNDCDGTVDILDEDCAQFDCETDDDRDDFIYDLCIGGNDCDDDDPQQVPGACGASCHPGLPEDCNDYFDNDCNDIVNDGCPPSPSCTGTAKECRDIEFEFQCGYELGPQYGCFWDDPDGFGGLPGTCVEFALQCANSFFDTQQKCESQMADNGQCSLPPCPEYCQWNAGDGGKAA